MAVSRDRLREVGFVLALLPLLFCMLAAVRLGPLADARGPFLALVGGAGAAWLVAVLLARGVPVSRPLLVALVAGAVALRMAAFAGAPELSDDVHRYVWEGALVAEGKSPYAFAPDDPRLGEEAGRWAAVHARVNHRDVSAAYPPLTQLANAGVVAAAGGPAVRGGRRAERLLRAAYALCDLALFFPLLGLLRSRGRSPALAVAWAWCPLVALEFAGSGHFDALGILLLVGALHVFELARSTVKSVRRSARENAAVLLLALGTLVKLLPACVLPFVLRPLERRVQRILLFLLVLVLCTVPILALEGRFRGLGGGLSEYAFRWESFNVVFRWIEAPFDALFPRDEGLLDPRRLARALVFVLWIGIGVGLWRARAGALRAAFVMIGAFLVLTPTLHPWYLTWIVPFLAVYRSRAWFFLVAVAPLLYWPLPGWRERAEWVEPVWLWPAVAVPFLLLLALEAPALRRGIRPA